MTIVGIIILFALIFPQSMGEFLSAQWRGFLRGWAKYADKDKQ